MYQHICAHYLLSRLMQMTTTDFWLAAGTGSSSLELLHTFGQVVSPSLNSIWRTVGVQSSTASAGCFRPLSSPVSELILSSSYFCRRACN